MLGIAACGDDDALAARAECTFGEEHRLATAPGGVFHGVALTTGAGGERATAVWSHRAGLFARALSPNGAPRGAAVRLGPGCEGGVAAAQLDAGLAVACVRRAMPEADKPGQVIVLRLGDGLEPRARATFGPAGRDSYGVDLAADGDAVWVAWHDGTAGAHRAWLARTELGGDGSASDDPRAISREGVAAGAPSVAMHGERPVVAWAETWFGTDGYLVGKVLVSDLRGAPRETAVIIHEDARPTIARSVHGLLLAYRDEQPAGSRPRLFVTELTSELDVARGPVVVGRANGEGGPSLLECEGALTTVAPRSYGIHDILVGINRFDRDLERIGVERQIYEYGMRFAHAATACAGDHLLVLTAERGETPDRDTALTSTVVDCAR